MNIGGLTIEMAADLARLRQDMDDAKRSVSSAMADIQKAVDIAKTAFVALAGIGSVAAFAGMIKGSIDATAALHDLSIQTGASVAALGAFKSVGSYTETSAESIAGAMNKLAKNMAMADEDSKGAAVAIKALGLNFDDFKKLKPEDQMLVAAKAMNQFEDGADKTAAAMLLFGKEGAKLLPFLKDLGDEADAVTAKLTDQEKSLKANQAAMADAFGDNLTKIRKDSEAWKKDIATGMLPALYEASQAFIDVADGAGGLREYISKLSKDGTITEWSRMAVAAVTYVADAFQISWRILETIGKSIGVFFARLATEIEGVGAAAKKAASGDFSGAVQALQRGFAQSEQMAIDFREETLKAFSESTWGSKMRDRMAELRNVGAAGTDAKVKLSNLKDVVDRTKVAQEAAARAAKEHETELKRQQQSADAAAKALQSFADSVKLRNSQLQAEIDLGRELTPVEKELLKIDQELEKAKRVMTAAQYEATAAQAEATRQDILRGKALEDEANWIKESHKANDAVRGALEKNTETLAQQVEKQEEANQAIGRSSDQLAWLEVVRLQELATSKERTAVLMDEVDWSGRTGDEYRKQAEELRKLAELKADGIHLKAAQGSAEEWKKTTESVYNGLTDSLMRAFENGKGFAQAFKDTLVNAFKTMVLRPVIQAILQPVGNGISSMFGMSGGASGGGGIGSLLGSLGNGLQAVGGWFGEGSTAGGWINNAGSWLSNGGSSILGQSFAVGSNLVGSVGWGNTGSIISTAWQNGAYGNALGMGAGAAASSLGGFMAGRGIGQTISGGYSAIGSSGNTAVNIGSAIGAIWGPVGSAIGGAVGGLVNRAFGRGPKETRDSGLQGTIVSGDFSGQTYANWTQKGGWFRSDKHGTDYGAVPAEMSQALDEGAAAVYSQVQAYAHALKLPGDSLKSVSYSLRVKLGQDEKENQKAFSQAFVAYQEQLSGTFARALAPFRKAGESLSDTLSRLAALQSFSEGLNQFGGIFSKVANLSVSAKEELIGFAGGIEAFVAKTKNFVDAYYTDAEKYGLKAKELRVALQAMGIDAGALTSRADFRKLVEGTDISTTEGRRQLDQLLTLAQAFAPIGQYLEQQGGSLASLANAAPQTALLESILNDQKAKADYAQRQQASLDALNAVMGRIHDSLERGFGGLTGSLEARMTSLVTALMRNGRLLGDRLYEMER